MTNKQLHKKLKKARAALILGDNKAVLTLIDELLEKNPTDTAVELNTARGKGTLEMGIVE